MVQKRISRAYKQHDSADCDWWNRNSPVVEIEDEGAIERKIGFVTLILSFSILTTKLMFANSEILYNLIFEKRLIQYSTIITDGEVLMYYARTNVLKYSKFWFPAVCGCLITWFTWLMVFLDSCVPGVTPPSPLSPSKFRVQSGHTFHLNYIFAVVIGILVAAYMYARGIALEF